MGSRIGSEMRTGEKLSNFSATCSRLSQYIKEKRNLGDLEITPRSLQPTQGEFRPPTTMNLLPGVDVSAEEQTETQTMKLFPYLDDLMKPEKAQMTIFYGGKVLIFDNFPASKANELMRMAQRESSNPPIPSQPIASDLPIARRVSLQRFLEKRKERVNSMAPYQVSCSSSVVAKQESIPHWLRGGDLKPALSSER